MTGELTENSSDSGAGDGCMSLLKFLGREEILEVLSEGLCRRCQPLLEARIHRILNRRGSERPKWNDSNEGSESFHRRPHKRMRPLQSFPRTPEPSYSSRRKRLVTDNRNSFEHSDFKIVSSGFDNGLFEEKKEQIRISPQATRKKDFECIERIDGRQRRFTSNSSRSSGFEMLLNDGPSRVSSGVDSELSEERKELIRMSQIVRKKDFAHIERINQKPINVLQGLELHTNVFNTEEQKNIVDYVYKLQRMGQRRELRERTYSEPKKWMRGKGRVTIQFGCCYNYAKDRNGNPPGIIRDEEVDPIPPLFKKVIKRMVRWQVLPPTCIPDSCIVNIYEEGDCIPPHIDHHDFVRPFYTLSFLSECNIVFGSTLEVVGPGEFSGPVTIPLPVGSVFILNGNGADIAKHCIPGVPAKRISITFRKMDESKLPYRFLPDPELVGIKPLICSPMNNSSLIEKDDSPPQDSLNAPNRLRVSEGRSNRSNGRFF